ncbi:ABC transporter substrate-binding protein [Desulfosporosinus sp. BICA1-9]|uniref:ABC transporter substrate-binding protein n=1 Tax=Desulfosporosinus sp. BICA1-9 TaxID=1531958 RepID=UPI00054C357F|nr:ABC transporter substrate-binding protein [Desulfosporosinus sp. BICA1-9]KJS46732.1 MAG: ABC transporter substrate-binding protein [Peptococcaceae bacterium BRH_c23]KJS85080.1 MAG: ABC transporter substrate-binding protein [Desulfosporosinus sp. BICA1-9]HBW34104.1 ABC transporter substrate-binding protein [Desulfosporosinus sp.]
MKRQNLINNSWLRLILVVLLIGTLFLAEESMMKKTILIGFAAQLTGVQAELGVQERNGVQMALETINATGGVDGRKIELIIRDDHGIPEKAQAADRELIKAGVLAIIGHTTSEQTLAGLEVTNPAKVVLLGPTVSTPDLSGIDDYFFRVYPSFKNSAQAFAQYIYQRSGITRLAIIYDSDNAAYSKTYCSTFSSKYQSMGGAITSEISFSSVAQSDFSPLLLKLSASKAEGLLIIASDIDTALIAQRTRLMGWQTPLFTSCWAPTKTLINNGGQAVEGIKFEQAYALTSQSPTLLDFQARYQTRFGQAPSFGAALAYDSFLVLAAALEKTGGRPEGLRQALLETHDFQGLMNTFSFDRFGDVERPIYLSTIRDGKFITLEDLTLTDPGGE